MTGREVDDLARRLAWDTTAIFDFPPTKRDVDEWRSTIEARLHAPPAKQ